MNPAEEELLDGPEEEIVEGEQPAPLEEGTIEVVLEEKPAEDRPATDEAALAATEAEFEKDPIRKPSIKKRFDALSYKLGTRERELDTLRRDHDVVKQYANGARQVIEQMSKENSQLQEALKRTALESTESKIALLRQQYATAREANNLEQEAQIAQDLAVLTQNRAQVASYNIPEPFSPRPLPAPSEQIEIPQEAMDWAKNNTWFRNDPRMTSYAVTFSNLLLQRGIAENTPEYYNHIDAEMRRVYPEKFGLTANTPAKTNGSPSTVRRHTPVATPQRTTGAANGTRKVSLTPGQQAIAKKFGLTNEQFAKYVPQEDK